MNVRGTMTCGLLVLVAVGWWILEADASSRQDSPRDTATRIVDPPPVGVSEVKRPTSSDIAVRPFRRSDEQGADPTGSLRLELRFSDGSPAAGVGVLLARGAPGNAWRVEFSFVADEAGRVRVRGLTPGPLVCIVDRGREHEIVIAALKETVSTLELDRGIDLDVLVEDPKGVSVADAGVWLRRWPVLDPPFLVGRTDAEGRCRVRSVTGHLLVGARHPLHGPSSLECVRRCGKDEAKHRLVLTTAGRSWVGRVLTPSGDPVSDATVLVGFPTRREFLAPDGPRAWAFEPFGSKTDSLGGFRVEGLGKVGVTQLQVRATGWAPWTEVLDLSDPKAVPREIRLRHPAEVFGRVVDARGEGVPGVRVTTESYEDLRLRSAVTSDDGVFRLEGMPSGDVTLTAMHREGRARTTLTLVEGQAREWSPHLVAGGIIEGRLQGRLGAPYGGWKVLLRSPRTPSPHGFESEAITGADGGFRFPNRPPSAHILEASASADDPFPVVFRQDIKPDGGLLTLEVAENEVAMGSLRGSVADPTGVSLAGAQILVHKRGCEHAASRTSGLDGEFSIDRLPPGRYIVEIRAPGFPAHRIGHELEPLEKWEIGRIKLVDTGTLAVQAKVGSGPPDVSIKVEILELSGVELGQLNLDKDGVGTTELVPGRYLVRASVHGSKTETKEEEVEVLPSKVTRVRLTIDPAMKK